MRDRIARFDSIGGTPIPRGSFGLGAPIHGDKRNNELYGNRIPSVGSVGSIGKPGSPHSTLSPSTSTEGLRAGYSHSRSVSFSNSGTPQRSPSSDRASSPNSFALEARSDFEGEPASPMSSSRAHSIDAQEVVDLNSLPTVQESHEVVTPLASEFSAEVTQVPGAQNTVDITVEVVEPDPGATTEGMCRFLVRPRQRFIFQKFTAPRTIGDPHTTVVVRESELDEDFDTSSDGHNTNPRSSLRSVTSTEGPATPLSPLFDIFPSPPTVSRKEMPISVGTTRLPSSHFDDLAVPSRSLSVTVSPTSPSQKPLQRAATTAGTSRSNPSARPAPSAYRRPKSKVLQPGVWINSDDEFEEEDDEGPGWASVVVTKRYI